MLDSLYITKSRIRRELLAIFFTNETKRYYLRELERMLGYSAGSMRRELLKFLKDGLLISERLGNLVYYSLNKKHPLFRELQGIVSKTIGVEGSLKDALALVKGIDMAFIYGSFASNRETSTSDIDLMIIGDPNMSLLNESICKLEKHLRREINPSIYTLDEYVAKKKAKSGFILELLKKPKIMLIGKEDGL